MRIVHIVGKKNHGKTRLLTELTRELLRTGHRVGTIKHCGHNHDLDAPGKDSQQHQEAGAESTLVLTPSRIAAFMPRRTEEDWRAQAELVFRDCDIVLAEGWWEGPGPKIEVWRREMEGEPLANERRLEYNIVAIATDDPVEVDVPVCSRSDIASLARLVLETACML